MSSIYGNDLTELERSLGNADRVTKEMSGFNALTKSLGSYYRSPAFEAISKQQGMLAGLQETQRRIADITAPFKTAVANMLLQNQLADSLRNLGGSAFTIQPGIADAMKGFNSSVGMGIDRQSVLSSMTSGMSTFAATMEANRPFTELYKTFPQYVNPLKGVLDDVDFGVLSQVADDTVDTANDSDTEEADSEFFENVADAYNKEVVADSKAEKKRHKITAEEVKLWLKRILFFIGVFSDICTIGGFVNQLMESGTAKPKVVYQIQTNNTNYFIQNFYGYDPKELNDGGYRITNQDITVRIKHNCKSPVVDQLEAGTPIHIVDKYKKWRQIEWTGDDDETYMGWIQNWKLEEFKKISDNGK